MTVHNYSCFFFDGLLFILMSFYCLFTDPLGRKRAMILVNIPYLVGWLMLYRANSVLEVFLAFIMLGMAVGLMEAPIVTYLGEVW